MTFREAGGIIADLVISHQKELNYMDFYCCINQSSVDKEIEIIMADHGWSWKRYMINISVL